MKIDEVPQDKGFLVEGRISDLNYALDKDGHYTSKQSLGWKPKNEAMNLAWELVYEKAENTREQVLNGKLSPLAFYMELNIMDVGILAGYMGISKWRVRRHLRKKHFSKLKPEMLAKYAAILNLSPSELVDTNKIRGIKLNED
jgi:hypothetical protein